MKKRILPASLLLLVLLLPTYDLQAQGMMKGNWMKNWGGEGLLENYIQVTGNGNILQTGVFNGSTFSMGPYTLNLEGQANLYAAMISPMGMPLWVKQFITYSSWDFQYLGSHVDALGYLYFVGSYADTTMTVDGALLRDDDSNTKVFLSIFDNGGKLLNLTNPLPPDNTAAIYPTCISWSPDGMRMAIGGYFEGDSLYAGDITLKGLPGNYKMFLFMFDRNGSPLWGVTNEVVMDQGEPSSDITPSRITFDMQGGVTVSGTFSGTDIVFGEDTIAGSQNASGVMLVHYDAEGKYIWSTGDAPGDYMNYMNFSQVLTTEDGGLLVSGVFGPGEISLGDVPLTSPNNSSYFLYRFSAQGTVMWSQMLNTSQGGQYKEQGSTKASTLNMFTKDNDIALDANGDIYLVGYFNTDVLDFPGDEYDLTRHSSHDVDQFVARYGADGTFRWAKTIASNRYGPPKILINYDGSLFVCDFAPDTLFLDGDTLAPEANGSVTYVAGFAYDGTTIFKEAIYGDDGSYMEVMDFGMNSRNNLYVLGTFNGNIQLGRITLSPAYNNNLFLANLSPKTFLQGIVVDNAGNPVNPGMVSLIRLGRSGMAPQADVAYLQTTGTFIFRDFVYGNYLIYALPDADVYSDYVGTYLGDTPLWFEADTFSALSDTTRGYVIRLAQLNQDLTGEGVIEGAIYLDTTGTGTRKSFNLEGEPVKKVKVILIGVQKSDDNIIAWAYTDEDGQYRFENVPDGNYTIMVDIPGLPLDTTYNVSVTGGIISGLDFLVTDTSITIAKTSGIAWPLLPVETMEVWPNPTTGPVTLRATDMPGAEVSLFNLSGQILMTFRLDREEQHLDLSGLPNGIYYLKAYKGNRIGLARLIIQR